MPNDTPTDPLQAITAFLRAARDRDLPAAELFRLKAEAFSLMADAYDEDGEAFYSQSIECRDAAIAARQAAVRACPHFYPDDYEPCTDCGRDNPNSTPEWLSS